MTASFVASLGGDSTGDEQPRALLTAARDELRAALLQLKGNETRRATAVAEQIEVVLGLLDEVPNEAPTFYGPQLGDEEFCPVREGRDRCDYCGKIRIE